MEEEYDKWRGNRVVGNGQEGSRRDGQLPKGLAVGGVRGS